MKDLFEKLFASVPLTVLVLSVIFLALGAIGGIPMETPIQPVDSSGRFVFFAVGGILLVISLILVITLPASGKTPNRFTYGITIDRLPGNSPDTVIEVESSFPKISGTFRKKPTDGVLQLFVYDPHKERYWPQGTKNIEWKDKKWYGGVNMGGEPPYQVTVVVGLVPPSGQALSRYYREMGELSEKFKKAVGVNSDAFQKFKSLSLYWKAIDGKLPEDVIEIGRVNLKRIK